MEVETIRRLIYEVKKVKIEDVLFEECNNLLRQIREELYDLRKECDNRVHILLRANIGCKLFDQAQAGIRHIERRAILSGFNDLEVIIFIFRADLADDEATDLNMIIRVLQDFAHILRNSGKHHRIIAFNFYAIAGGSALIGCCTAAFSDQLPVPIVIR